MPHLFVNRPRVYDLLANEPQQVRKRYRWEALNAFLYKLGGLLFIVGSILFFPALAAWANLGAWTFFAGSILYLVVTAHDLAEVVQDWRSDIGPHTIWERFEFWAASVYLVGTLLFLVGSIFFLSWVDWEIAGAWCFVVGSLLFVLGASINVLQITRATELVTLQLMNLTAVTFVTGSVLFTVASIPYLWQVENAADQRLIDGFLAWQYLVGSALFLLGGIFNSWRAYVVVRRELEQRRRMHHGAAPEVAG
ncbi:YrhK family protein [Acuticoccus sp. I52.16.1]|uniref:YrhK family protein n=1 Tax=Acuticoccus sp. I52.16.1 TaxID=2928472 RepID=UPI001FD57C3D|nr:YrhK family protein [Acuticoccus sp. I52.16.1]UOM34874.1 YrhK family protein [Acuticoccus sp. I52.16.1]